MLATGAPQPAIKLWPDKAPGALGNRPQDTPTLTPFLPAPDKATGASVVVCPGGGYGFLAPHEGEGYAKWLTAHGVAAFVLKYRLGSDGYHHPTMLQDVSRAIRLVRARAASWKIDPHRVAVMGSSAGGHLAATALTHFDAGDAKSSDPIEQQSSRPDMGILCYPVITMGAFTHAGSKANLLGPTPAPELVDLLSNEKQVRDDTPTTFVWATDEDRTVPVENSLEFATALRAHHVPFELHIYEKGGHGMGLGQSTLDPTRLHPWTDDLLHWLHEHGYANP
jgi:acetyl esterase/lipase